MRLAVAIDAGGTSTRAVLVDEAGTCLGLGRAGAGNPSSSGADHAVSNLLAATRQAMSGAPECVTPELVLLSAAGMMSTATPLAADAFAGLGIRTLETTGDVQGAYFTGTAAPDGYVVIVGTGAIVGRMIDGELAQVRDGIGYLLGDEGSGFWIGQAVARAVAADLDRRGPHTGLTDLVTATLSAPIPSDGLWLREPLLGALVARTYARRAVELAEYARFALQLPDDPVAAGIVREAAAKVESLTASMVDDDGTPLVLAGGLLFDGSPLAEPLRARWAARCLRAEDGMAGAALIALRHLGVPTDGDTLARIHQTLAALRRA